MSEVRLPAVVLAGGKPGEELATQAGVPYKALIPIKGRPMVAWVVEALSRAETVSQVLLAGPPEVAAAVPEARWVPDAGSFLGNLAAGVSANPSAAQCLVVTCDIPFITAEIVDDFVRQAAACNVDLVYPYVQLHLCKERFPGIKRSSIRVREGRLTGGNAVLIRPGFLARNGAVIDAAYAARKTPFRMVGMLGWGVVTRLLLAQAIPWVLAMHHVETCVGKLIGGAARAIPVAYPEIGTDVDRPDDLAMLPR